MSPLSTMFTLVPIEGHQLLSIPIPLFPNHPKSTKTQLSRPSDKVDVHTYRSDSSISMRGVTAGSVTMNTQVAVRRDYGNPRSDSITRLYTWDTPLPPLASQNRNIILPSSLSTARDGHRETHIEEEGTAKASSEKTTLTSTRAHLLENWTPLVPTSTPSFDCRTTHPASVGSTSYTNTLADPSDPRIVHPASPCFTTPRSAAFDVTTTHPASVGSRTMSLPLTTPENAPVSCSRPTFTPINVQTTHPASIFSYSHNRPFFPGPSDSRYIHPASSHFSTFDPRTTHPASIMPSQHHLQGNAGGTGGSGSGGLDKGDSRFSHPAWIGFGVGQPQKSKL